MKRLLSVSLFLMILFGLCGMPAFALVSTEPAPFSTDYTPLETAIREGLLRQDENIDISEFGADAEALSAAYQHVYYTSPDLFYVALNESYSYAPSTPPLTTFRPAYHNMTPTEIEEGKQVVENTLNHIVSGVSEDFTDFEKALYVHDYIIQNYEYDSRATDADINVQKEAIRDTLGFFTEKKGVCVSYALTFYGCMAKLGIPVDVVTSDSLAHIWNVVQIDGNWYHADLTWDDPVMTIQESGSQDGYQDTLGIVKHFNFLKSDNYFSKPHEGENSHVATDWVVGNKVTCTNQLYDTIAWNDVDGAFCYADGDWYYMANIDNYQNTGIATYDFTTNQTNVVKAINDKWSTVGGTYLGSFANLGAYKGVLYYNTPGAIYSYNPVTSETKTVYTLDRIGNPYLAIYNFVAKDNVAHFMTKTGFYNNPTYLSETLVRRYKIRFVDSDMTTLIFSCEVDEGSIIPTPRYTEKTENYITYPLLCWQGFAAGLTVATADTEFVAVYDTENATVAQFSYIFYDADGVTVLARGTLAYNSVIPTPPTPQRASDDVFSYTFSGWEGFTEGMTISRDVAFRATYTTAPVASFAPTTTENSPGDMLASPLVWVVIGVVLLAVFIPVWMLAGEARAKRREEKKKQREREKRGWGDEW